MIAFSFGLLTLLALLSELLVDPVPNGVPLLALRYESACLLLELLHGHHIVLAIVHVRVQRVTLLVSLCKEASA